MKAAPRLVKDGERWPCNQCEATPRLDEMIGSRCRECAREGVRRATVRRIDYDGETLHKMTANWRMFG